MRRLSPELDLPALARWVYCALLCVATSASALLLTASNVAADALSIDTFEYNVVEWTPDAGTFPGSYLRENGDYTLRPSGQSADGLLITAGPGPFERWDELWYRSAARLNGGGKIGLTARYDLATDSGYAGWLDSSGQLELLRLDHGQATVLKAASTLNLFPAGAELWLELSLWNNELSFSAGSAQNQILARISAVDANYGEGQAGLVFQGAAPESAGVFHEVSWSSKYLFPGDVDWNRTVDLTDFGLFKLAFGNYNDSNPADFSGDNKVDLTDFGMLKDHFGESAGPEFAAVPEPRALSLSLAALAAIAVLAVGRRGCAAPLVR